MMRTAHEIISPSLKTLLGVVTLFLMFPLFGQSQSSSYIQCQEEGYYGNELVECQAELNAGNPYPPYEAKGILETIIDWLTQPLPDFTHTRNTCEWNVAGLALDVCEGCLTATVLTESVTTCEDDRSSPIGTDSEGSEDDGGRKGRR